MSSDEANHDRPRMTQAEMLRDLYAILNDTASSDFRARLAARLRIRVYLDQVKHDESSPE